MTVASVVGYSVDGVLGLIALGLAKLELVPSVLEAAKPRAAAGGATLGALSPAWALETGAVVLAYWALAIALVFMNSWLMDGLFPYAATLTLVQMVVGAAVSAALVYGCELAPAPEGLTLEAWATHFLPVGALYAVYLWGSNACYDYLEVGFVQMLKPSCGLFTYFLLLRGGLETWTTRKALNLLVMFGALSMSSLGQSELGRFSLAGVVVLLSSQLANALYAVSLQRILQRIGAPGGAPLRLNPLTTLMCVGPAAALWLAALAAAIEWREPSFAWTIPTWVLAANCALAVGLNLAIMAMIQRLSALSYNLLGCAKDVIVVGLSAVIDHEAINHLEIASYAVAMFAQVLWAHRKISEKLTAARKAADAPPETSEKLLDEPEADEPDSVGAALSKMYGALVPGAGKAEC